MSERLDAPDTRSFVALRQIARQAARSAEEHCDLCAEPIEHEHRHILQLPSRELLCACRACAILFDQAAAGAGTRRLVSTGSRYLAGFDLTDAEWESLRVPVDMAFFISDTGAGRVMAFYPGPAGPTESLLALETWAVLEQRNPVLRAMQPDVEALLVNRVRGAREYFLVPIDACYHLVGLFRLHWKGLSGGREVWQEIERFFSGVKARAEVVGGADA